MKKRMPFRRRLILPYNNFIRKVNSGSLRQVSDEMLRLQLKEWDCRTSDEATVYRLLKEVIFRVKGVSLFDTQLAAAYGLQQEKIVQLPTGEGKTLAAVVAASCFALQGKSVHILVFNDYLARRDYEDNREIYQFCGVTSGYLTQETKPAERRAVYQCQVVYASAKEAGFDYLRDFLATAQSQLMKQPFQVALVDEADSVLIDEARIPLVLAGPGQEAAGAVQLVDAVVSQLGPEHMVVREKQRQVWLTDAGIDYIEKRLEISNLYGESGENFLPLVSAALEGRYLYKKGRDYIVKEKSVLIIDENTGRIAGQRKFPDLLHQAIETKEKAKSGVQTKIFNSMPMQFFLLHYETLCGMTGTAKSAEKELKSMYGRKVVQIPPHVPCRRVDHEDEICEDNDTMCQAIVEKIKAVHAKGQPILLGTRSVGESEEYAQALSQAGLVHVVLNARNDEAEGQLIARAGEPYRITVSTNMAGRGVDIHLGGKEEAKKNFVTAAGGLFVIGAGRNRSKRIDDQLRGRAGRQGDPGESKFYVSREAITDQKRETGNDAEARYILEKYAFIIEKQRQLITAYRLEVLEGMRQPGFLQKYRSDLQKSLSERIGAVGVILAERQLTLHFINRHWADYLATMEAVREGIHLVIIGGRDPLAEYHRFAVKAFSQMEQELAADVIRCMQTCKITKDGIDMEAEGLCGATTTWTYMIDESRGQFVRLPEIILNKTAK